MLEEIISHTKTKSNEIMLNKHDFGAFDGGCLIYAHAILLAFPEAFLVRIISPNFNNQTEHYGACLAGAIYDADGVHTNPVEWIESFRKNEHVNDRDLAISFHFDHSSEIPRDVDTSNQIAQLFLAHTKH